MVQSVATEKIPSVIPTGIDPKTFRLVEQCLNHYASPGPLINFIKYGETGSFFNPLNSKLNPICSLLALLGAHHILHVSRIRVN
jgi:hypothetical protein